MGSSRSNTTLLDELWGSTLDTYERSEMQSCMASIERRVPSYDFFNPIDIKATAKVDPFIFQLVTSVAFRRLNGVRFLGALDYLIVRYPNGARRNRRHNRFEHSLGVLRLAIVFANKAELSEKERKAVLSAALLHDVGHAPFSHTLEPVFERRFQINHHKATIDIVSGSGGSTGEIPKILEMNGINPGDVADILLGNTDPTGGFFSGPINFDTIEAILRSCLYFRGLQFVANPISMVCSAIDRANDNDRIAVDHFWRIKGLVYRYLIQSELGLLADAAFRSAAELQADALDPSDVFATERHLFSKLHTLSEMRGAATKGHLHRYVTEEERPFKRRQFFIDDQINFFSRCDTSRYRQTKEKSVLRAPTTNPSLPLPMDSLFHDTCI